jgi:predicted nucleotidyltransferase
MATAMSNKTVRRVRVTKRLLHDMVQRIVAHFQPEKIILFGSYAYGQPHADSDVDLLVIMESDEEPAQRAMRVLPVARVVGVPMDMLVRTPAEIACRLAIGDHFIKEILTTGRVLYERSPGTRDAYSSLSVFMPNATALNQYSVDYRYPGLSATLANAQDALKAARRIRTMFRKKLGV